MTLWPASVVLDNAVIPLDDVLADVSIHTGRQDITGDPTPSTCQLTMRAVTSSFVKGFRVGESLAVTVVGAPASNYRANGDFESTDLSGWWGPTAPTRDTTTFHAGAASGYFVPNPDGSGYFGGWTSNMPTVEGSRMRVRAWVKGSATAPSFALVLNGYNPNDYGIASVTKPLTTEWQYFEAEGVIAAGSGAGGYIYGASSITVPYWLDDIVVEWLDEPSPRFTGRITDAALLDDVLTVIAAGPLSTLGSYVIGAADWPVESWSARVTRCFQEAGLAARLELAVDPTFDPQLAGRTTATAGSTTLRDMLAFLAPMVGAAIVDRPNGNILVQAIGARSLDNMVALDPALVEFAPEWSQVLPQANVVTVRYTGDQSQSVTVRDDSSVALYGERRATIDTSFTSSVDATTRANQARARGSFPHWTIPETPVLEGLELTIGEPLTLTMLPPSSPFTAWTPIVEGWQDQISGPDWTMRVALSDPLASGLILPWNELPPDWLWNTINPSTPWNQALTLGDLAPA